MTRPELLSRLAERTGNRRGVERVMSEVLLAVRELAMEHFGDDWNGEQFIRRVDEWIGSGPVVAKTGTGTTSGAKSGRGLEYDP